MHLKPTRTEPFELFSKVNPALYSLWVESICCTCLLLAAEKGREAWQGPTVFPVSFVEKKGLLVVTKALV